MNIQDSLTELSLEISASGKSKYRGERLLHCICEMYCDRAATREMCQQALRLGKAITSQLNSSEAYGLVAWMHFHEARVLASIDIHGNPIPLAHQNRQLWNRQCTSEGMTYLVRSLETPRPGPYCLKAAVEALHNQAHCYEKTDWSQITSLLEALYQQLPAPSVAIERALAIGMRDSPGEGLKVLQELGMHADIRSLPVFKAVDKELQQRAKTSGRSEIPASRFRGAQPQRAF